MNTGDSISWANRSISARNSNQ